MNKDNPINNIHDLINAMRNGVNPIYVASDYYMKKSEPKKKCNTLLGDMIQVAYAYGCEFVEVKKV